MTLDGAWHSERGLRRRAACLFIPIQSNLKFCDHLCCNSISSLTGSCFFLFFFFPSRDSDSLELSSLLHVLQGQVTSLSLNLLIFKMGTTGNSLVVQWLRLGTFTGRPREEIPGQGTEIPQVASIAKKKTKNKKTQTKGINSSRLIKLLCGQRRHCH